MGIEPTYPAWKAGVLPLNYTRRMIGVTGFEPATSWSQTRRSSQAEPHPDISFICLPLRLCVSFVSPAATRYIIWHVSQKVNRFFKVFLLLKMSTLNSTFFHVFIVLPFCTIRSLFYCIFSLLGSAIVRLPLLPTSHAPYFRSYASCFTSSSNSSPAE